MDGATSQSVYTSPTGVVSYIYRPNSTTNMVVYNSGPSTYAGTAAAGITTIAATTIWNTMPNLVKESCNGVAFYPGGSGRGYNAVGPTRAAPVSTTSQAADGSTRIAPNSSDGISRNGRYVSVARWNKPLLLPKLLATMTTGATTGTTISDSGTTATAVAQPTPLSAFVAPDWILTVANGNSNPTSLNTSSTDLVNSNTNPKSASYVVGRYAYTIYNEGGLLDANVAGCPPGSSAAQQVLISRKGPAAFADLTQLPGIADIDTVESSTTRSPAIVSSLVGWRNTGHSPDLSYPPVSDLFVHSNPDNQLSELPAGLLDQFHVRREHGPLHGTERSHLYHPAADDQLFYEHRCDIHHRAGLPSGTR